MALAIAAAPAATADLPPPAFQAPAAGSYDLPVVDLVRDHPVVDSSGEATTLFALKRGRLAVVAFVYASCPDMEGCPLSQSILYRLDRALAADAALGKRVSLVSLSFDAARDTPDKLAALRRVQRPQSDWRFVTTRGGPALADLLDDFNQSVVPLRDDDGRFTGRYRHVMKIFLLDEENRVRNVYSSGLLSPELVLADLQTLKGDS